MYRAVEVQLHAFLTLVLGKLVVSFMPWLLYLQGKDPGTHWIGSCMGPRASLDMVVKRKNLCPFLESNPCCPYCSLVTILTELFELQTCSQHMKDNCASTNSEILQQWHKLIYWYENISKCFCFQSFSLVE
jgi:hypothetical protein